MRGQDQGQQVALTIHLGSGRLDGGLDRFDGYIAAGFGVGSRNDVAGPELLREDGRGALGFAVKYALGADKSNARTVTFGSATASDPVTAKGTTAINTRAMNLTSLVRIMGRPSVAGREIRKFADR